jgi:uncharacterized protein (DUF1499 family)
MHLLKKYILPAAAALVALAVIGLAVAARLVPPPDTLGVREGQLTPCPDSPNCVSSQSSDPQHAMEPISYDTTQEEARARLLSIIGSMERTTVLESRADYIHVEFRSQVFGFPDDVEFFFDEANKQIHFRAAARLGHSDMGVNRARMQSISDAFIAGAGS